MDVAAQNYKTPLLDYLSEHVVLTGEMLFHIEIGTIWNMCNMFDKNWGGIRI